MFCSIGWWLRRRGIYENPNLFSASGCCRCECRNPETHSPDKHQLNPFGSAVAPVRSHPPAELAAAEDVQSNSPMPSGCHRILSGGACCGIRLRVGRRAPTRHNPGDADLARCSSAEKNHLLILYFRWSALRQRATLCEQQTTGASLLKAALVL